jgi:hypothetical protein
MTESLAASHPIGLIVEDDLKRSRLTVFFRLLLAIPQVIWIGLWGVAVAVVIVMAWLAGLILGRVPGGLHGFIARYLRALTHVSSYLLLLADPWPPFGGREGSYPVDLRVDPAALQSRVTIFFRWLLAIPAFLLVYVFRAVNQIIAFIGWFYCLATGHMHEGMRDVSAWMLRYELQAYGYIFLLTSRYPSFEGGPRV